VFLPKGKPVFFTSNRGFSLAQTVVFALKPVFFACGTRFFFTQTGVFHTQTRVFHGFKPGFFTLKLGVFTSNRGFSRPQTGVFWLKPVFLVFFYQ